MAGHTHASIRPVKRRVEDELLAREGVTGVDIDTKKTGGQDTGTLSIVVFVKSKKPPKNLKAAELIPSEIDGIPTDVVEEDIVLHAGASMLLGDRQVDATTYSTLQGGISMGPCRAVHLDPPDVPASGDYIFVGTLGLIVKDRTTGAKMALTNFHVACVDSHWAVGDTQTHPGRVDGGSCPTGKFGSIVRAVLSNHVDGAVVSIDPGKAMSCSIVEIGNVKGTAGASIGQAVRKRGRTTGLTYGNVVSIDFTTSIDYGDGLGVHILRNQIRIDVDTSHSTQFGDHGDSGSAVVDSANKVVGLHFAGNTAGTMGIANPIAFVQDELNVDVCVDKFILVTKPIICDPFVTRPIICEITRPVVCNLVTKVVICDIITKPGKCDLITKFGCPPITAACPPRSLACGPGFPGGPGNPGNPGFGGFADNDPSAAYGNPGAEDAFWLGYYTALSAVDDALQTDE
jgi:hypothetical protein